MRGLSINPLRSYRRWKWLIFLSAGFMVGLTASAGLAPAVGLFSVLLMVFAGKRFPGMRWAGAGMFLAWFPFGIIIPAGWSLIDSLFNGSAAVKGPGNSPGTAGQWDLFDPRTWTWANASQEVKEVIPGRQAGEQPWVNSVPDEHGWFQPTGPSGPWVNIYTGETRMGGPVA